MDRWLEWAQEKPGRYVSANGKWLIEKVGIWWLTYLRDNYDWKGRFVRLRGIPDCRTLTETQDWVAEYDVRGFNEFVDAPDGPYLDPSSSTDRGAVRRP